LNAVAECPPLPSAGAAVFRSSLGSAKTGGKGIRTPDLLIANETLYQLSYTPKEEQRLSWRNDFSASDSENSEQPDLLLSLSRTENKPAKFAAFEFCGRNGVIECVLFAVSPVQYGWTPGPS
jgi:hypothetical protein